MLGLPADMAAGHLCSLAVLPALAKPVLQGTVARPWTTGHLLRQLLGVLVEMLRKLLSSTQQTPESPSVGEMGSEREKQTDRQGRGEGWTTPGCRECSTTLKLCL